MTNVEIIAGVICLLLAVYNIIGLAMTTALKEGIRYQWSIKQGSKAHLFWVFMWHIFAWPRIDWNTVEDHNSAAKTAKTAQEGDLIVYVSNCSNDPPGGPPQSGVISGGARLQHDRQVDGVKRSPQYGGPALSRSTRPFVAGDEVHLGGDDVPSGGGEWGVPPLLGDDYPHSWILVHPVSLHPHETGWAVEAPNPSMESGTSGESGQSGNDAPSPDVPERWESSASAEDSSGSYSGGDSSSYGE